ncbi:hypothetical protein [Cesiribacter sp. SM1]|uniref:hypothetical protein n=1 Tax=Cesiribacter sp. SM1 TaxID=2861196 RepID=UPI001CD4EFD2|nr:hypothetical protein [Cesiribacter sp. SM1]
MKKIFSPLFTCLCFLLCSSSLLAQDVLLITSEMLDKKAKSTVNRVYLTADKVLMESDDQNEMTTLYDATKEEMYLINHKKKEYTLMDKAAMAEMNAQMQEAARQMEQTLQQMPESQRKMMEEQMRKIMGSKEPVTYEKEQAQAPVKNWKSTKYVGKSGDKLRHEVYVVTYKDLGEDKDNFKALVSLYTLLQSQLQEMGRNMPGMMAFSMPEMLPGGEEGLPVKSIYYDVQGQPDITSTMNTIEKTTLAADKWQVPPKYKQKKFTASAK